MGWSWEMGRIAGIKLRVHWTFLLLIAWVIYSYLSLGETYLGAALGVVFVLAIFACIVLHELGHALTARRFGVPTQDITLLPIGGVARLQRIPDHPAQELAVAIAGPLVNVAIAAVLFVLLLPTIGLHGMISALGQTGVWQILPNLLLVNIFLIVFNMLPAFPMDGGRVLRALLAMQMDYAKATNIAATVGQGMAILFAIAGLFGNPFLLIIALFVYLGADGEARMVRVRTLLRDLPVREAMITHYHALAPTDTLGTAIDHLLTGSQHDFPVAEAGVLQGLVLRDDLVQALGETSRDQPITEIMQTDCPQVSPNDMLFAVMERLQQTGCSTVPVVHNGRLVGLITLENIGELMMVRSAIRGGRPSPEELTTASQV